MIDSFTHLLLCLVTLPITLPFISSTYQHSDPITNIYETEKHKKTPNWLNWLAPKETSFSHDLLSFVTCFHRRHHFHTMSPCHIIAQCTCEIQENAVLVLRHYPLKTTWNIKMHNGIILFLFSLYRKDDTYCHSHLTHSWKCCPSVPTFTRQFPEISTHEKPAQLW